MSQDQFAKAVRAAGTAMGAENHCTKRLVQKWETGEHAACRPEYLRVLQVVTGLSARELGFQLLPDQSGLVAAVSVDRAEAAGTEALDGERAADKPTAAFSATDYSSDALVEMSMDRLRHALNHPSTVEMRTARLAETAIARLFDLEHHSPARLLAPTVDRRLATLTGLLTAARVEGVRQVLTVSAGRGALLAGWLAFDRGDTASAHRWWEEASSAAEGTMDGGLFAACLIYQSYAAERRADSRTAWRLAHTASQQADDPRATAWALSRVARYAARLEEFTAAEAAMHEALDIGEGLPSPAPGDDSKPWTRFFDRAMVLAEAAHTAAVLGDPKALDLATRAVDALSPAKVKARAVVLAEVAFTAAWVGDFKLCLDHGRDAAKLARELDVSVAADVLHEVVALLLPESHERAVRELLPHLARVVRSLDLQDKAEREPESTAV